MRLLLLTMTCVCLVTLQVTSSWAGAKDGGALYRGFEYLYQLEQEGGVYNETPAWIMELLREELPAGELPAAQACSLGFNPDNWSAAGVLLELILDENVVRRIRSNQDLEIVYTRAVRYLRPAIVIRFAALAESPSEKDRMRAVWWADGLLRLFPHPEEGSLRRARWEISPRPWSSAQNISELASVNETESTGNERTAYEIYRAFVEECGVDLLEVVPKDVMQAYLDFQGSYFYPDHWYYKGMTTSWLALFMRYGDYSPNPWEWSQSLGDSSPKAERFFLNPKQYSGFLVAMEYLRPALVTRFCHSDESAVYPRAFALCSLDRLLFVYIHPDDDEVG